MTAWEATFRGERVMAVKNNEDRKMKKAPGNTCNSNARLNIGKIKQSLEKRRNYKHREFGHLYGKRDSAYLFTKSGFICSIRI